MTPKFIAFYLPQFHSIPENDKWWGKGFTEWVRVRESKPLFKDHNQPRIPFNYYDLDDINVIKQQSRLAMDYGIYGFCYYHYWFNGKLLLERPLNQMLNDKGVEIPFCLSWANEPWTRAWEGKSREILMEQKYGSESDWIKHLDYLIPFFQDERYIRKNGKPVFLIYRTSSFAGFDKMISKWNEVLVQKNLEPLYVIETLNSYQRNTCCEFSSGVTELEPLYTIKNKPKYVFYLQKLKEKITRKTFRTFDYDKVWNTIINRQNKIPDKDMYLGAFVDWDNSPRFKMGSAIFKNVTPENFYKYLRALAKKPSGEFLFINAWNEWAEGAYLEPDQRHQYGFLEAMKRLQEQSNDF
jgi:lipopolysaccharide biosynthesis protein